MTGRHARTSVPTPQEIKRAYRVQAQRRFDTFGLPRGLHVIERNG